MCRKYNDYGSAARDQDEGNLNSLEFDESCGAGTQCNGTRGIDINGHGHYESDEKAAKSQLMAIAEFEREGVRHAMATLEKLVPDKRVISMLRVFVDVTDTFGLVYMQKDIASTRIYNGTKYEGAGLE